MLIINPKITAIEILTKIGQSAERYYVVVIRNGPASTGSHVTHTIPVEVSEVSAIQIIYPR